MAKKDDVIGKKLDNANKGMGKKFGGAPEETETPAMEAKQHTKKFLSKAANLKATTAKPAKKKVSYKR